MTRTLIFPLTSCSLEKLHFTGNRIGLELVQVAALAHHYGVVVHAAQLSYPNLPARREIVHMPWVNIDHVIGTDRLSLELQVVANKLDIALASVGTLRQNTTPTTYPHFKSFEIGPTLYKAVEQIPHVKKPV